MPTDFPAYAFSDIAADPDLGMAHARTEGGLIVTSRNTDPFWRGRLTTKRLEGWQGNNQHADLRAFLSRCVDLHIQVDIVHPRHRVPGAYTLATWPMGGNASLAGLTDLRNIRVAGLPLGLVLKRGDRASIVQGNIVCHRWIAGAVTVSSTTVQAIELTPRLPIGIFTAGATVVLKDPVMRVLIVPGSWDTAEVADPSPISFDVAEAIA